jgi:hypothetical protein|tara:strand:- start:317 stop:3847 length:3531 start_codon:yes stop_codon:yes gene_type:complete
MSLLEQRYADRLGVTQPKAVTETSSIFDTSPAPSGGGSLLSNRFAQSDTFNNSVKSYEAIKRNPAVFEAAKRFLADRHGMTKVKDEDVIDEFISHFRSFDVNEMTTAGDYGYVSAAASDATKRDDEKAQMRLADYRLLYQTFREMPHFYEEGGAENAFGDYVEGLLKAPSTYLGLLLPGYGKAAGVASSQAAKAAVAGTLRQAFQPQRIGSRMIQAAASNPIKTTIAGEAAFGALQNVAAQKTELEADLRKEFDNKELMVTSVASGVLPAAAAIGLAKTGFSRFAERNVGDLLDEADKAELKLIAEANEAAEKTLNDVDDKILDDTKEVLRALDPEAVKRGEAVKDKVRDELETGYKMGMGMDKDAAIPGEEYDFIPTFDIVLDPSKKKRIFAMTTEILAKGGGRREGERITEAIGRVLRSASDETLENNLNLGDIFKKYNLTPDDFANMFMADVSHAARTLQQAGAVRKAIDASYDDLFGLSAQRKGDLYQATKALEEEGSAGVNRFLEKTDMITDDMNVGIAKRMLNGAKALDALRLASMTSQTGTTVRNTVSGVARVGIDTLTKALDRGISTAVGKNVAKANEDIFAVLFGITNKKEAMAIEAIFKSGFTTKASQMFRELQDIANTTDMAAGVKMDKMRAIGANLNALNQASDNMFKRAAFVGSLKRQLNELFTRQIREGNKTQADAAEYNLREIVRTGKFKGFYSTGEGKKMLDKAVEDALYFTYQKTPDSQVARALIDGIHKAPFLTTSLVPFPRFIANAMRFTYEYSPLYLLDAGFVRFAAKNQDNYEELAKGLVGTGLLMGAIGYRMSEHAGENWWEGRRADGSTYDLRPFFPAAPFLFLGDLVARSIDQDVANIAGFKEQDRPLYGDRNELADAIQALSGTQFRAGMGLYALDNALRDVMAEDDPQKAQRMLTAAAANIINTFSIPMTMLQDTYNTFAAPDDARIVRNTNSSDMLSFFINKSLARIPMNYRIEEFLSEKLGTNPSEIYQSPTRAEDLRRTTPFSRQVYGALFNERKNRFEKELAELKISRQIVFAKTGVPEADALIAQFMGEYITDYVVPAIEQSDVYDKLTREGKKDFLKRVIQEYRSDIMDLVEYNSKQPVYKERYGFDPMEKTAWNKVQKVDKERAMKVYHENHGVPEDGKYDYTKLLYYAKYIAQMRKGGVFDD